MRRTWEGKGGAGLPDSQIEDSCQRYPRFGEKVALEEKGLCNEDARQVGTGGG